MVEMTTDANGGAKTYGLLFEAGGVVGGTFKQSAGRCVISRPFLTQILLAIAAEQMLAFMNFTV